MTQPDSPPPASPLTSGKPLKLRAVRVALFVAGIAFVLVALGAAARSAPPSDSSRRNDSVSYYLVRTRHGGIVCTKPDAGSWRVFFGKQQASSTGSLEFVHYRAGPSCCAEPWRVKQ